jgi:hypothetical protein
MTNINVNGILLLYHHLLAPDAITIMDHINAFARCSRFKVWALNTELGFPSALDKMYFPIVVLHYSLFGYSPYHISDKFLNYLSDCDSSYKIAFFQDEYRFCKKRFDFINLYNINCIYTLVEPQYFKDVYQKYTNVNKLVYTIPGYVSDELITLAEKMYLPDRERRIDVGYRARQLAYYMGKGAQEKTEIGRRFLELGCGLGIKLDIAIDERHRIYGTAWYEFLANSRAVLGVEAGVSIFDLEDIVRTECDRILASDPTMSFEDLSKIILDKWENRLPYRTISPRHFEAAALRVCQILFEGYYSGIMQPMTHYIPLKKDFSNFNEVIAMFRDESLRRRLTENAYRDLIASGRYTYQEFIRNFDQDLINYNFNPDLPAPDPGQVTARLNQDIAYRKLKAVIRAARYYPFPGRRALISIIKSLSKKIKK